jgi:hypothetical protein
VQQSYADQNFRAKPSTAHGVHLLDGLNHNNNIFPSFFFYKKKKKIKHLKDIEVIITKVYRKKEILMEAVWCPSDWGKRKILLASHIDFFKLYVK